MLETIVSWIASVCSELLDFIVTAFLGMMHLDLGSISESFPALTVGYRIFQSIGIGLIVLIAVVQLFKFFLGQLADVRDTPVHILLRSAIAAMLIWFGGFFVELAIDLAKIPYDIFVNYDATETNDGFFAVMRDNLGDMNLIDGMTVSLGEAAMLVLSLILILLVGWNILKLMLEVCERYLMIGVLAYSSPLIYPTFSSQATSDIFKRWVGMFCGQCVLMTISAWMLKIAISGFSLKVTDTNVLFRIMLTLAFCKIAQRADTYMQQLGIGVATTGGNLLDEAIGFGMALSRGRGKRGGAGSADGNGGNSPVLGAGPDGSLSRLGGFVGGISNAAQRAAQQWKSGAPVSEIGRELGKNFRTGLGIEKGWQAVKKGAKNGSPGEVIKGVGQMAGGAMMAGIPANAVARMNAARAEARREATQGAYAGAADFNKRSADSRYKPPQGENPYQNPRGQGYDNTENMSEASKGVRDEQREAMQTASQYFAAQRAANGVGGYEVSDQNGDVSLDETAEKAGLRLDKGQDAPKIEGRDDVVGDYLAKNYEDFAKNDEMQEYAMNTVRDGSPLAAEQALNNPYCDLSGNDELGDAMLKKAYGEEAITGKPETGGQFTNISAETIGDNGRVIHTDYVAPDGTMTHYDIQNAEALNQEDGKARQFWDGMRGNNAPVEGAGSGATMYVHNSNPTNTNGTDSTASNSGSGGTFGQQSGSYGTSNYQQPVQNSTPQSNTGNSNPSSSSSGPLPQAPVGGGSSQPVVNTPNAPTPPTQNNPSAPQPQTQTIINGNSAQPIMNNMQNNRQSQPRQQGQQRPESNRNKPDQNQGEQREGIRLNGEPYQGPDDPSGGNGRPKKRKRR